MLTDNIQEDLKEAQLARDENKVSTLRLLLSEIHNAEIAKGGEPFGSEPIRSESHGRRPQGRRLSDQDIIQVIQREIKKRTEAAAGFRQGGREDQAQKEEAELKILKQYLPVQLSTEELTKIVTRAINELGAKTIADMGKVMGVVMGKVKGQADGRMVSSLVKEKLT